MCPGSDDIQHVARTKGLQLFCVGGGALWMRVSSGFPSSAALSKMWFFFWNSPCPHCTKLLWDLSTYLSHYSELELCGNGTETQSPILSPTRQSPHAVTGFTGKVQNFTSLFFFLHNFFNSYCVFLKKEVSRGNPFTVVAAVPFYWLGINIRKGKAVWGLWEELVLNIWLTS